MGAFLHFIRTLGVALGAAAPLAAQSAWLGGTQGTMTRVEYLIPDFDNLDFGLGTFTVFVTGRYTAPRGPTVIVEVPLTRAEGRFNTTFALGNPFLGAEIVAGSRATMEMGVRLPLGGDDGFGGTIADIDRWGAFGEHLLSFTWLGSVRQRDGSGRFFARLRGGPVALLPTDGGSGDLYLNVGGYWGVDTERARLIVGVTGIGLVSDSGLGFDDRTVWQGGGAVEFLSASLRAGLQVRLPIDQEMRSLLDAVYGLAVAVTW